VWSGYRHHSKRVDLSIVAVGAVTNKCVVYMFAKSLGVNFVVALSIGEVDGMCYLV